MVLPFFQKIEKGEHFSHLFYEAGLNLVSKPEKYATEKILQTNTFNKRRRKLL